MPGKLNRFIDFDNALTHHRDFVFGVLGVTEARSSYDEGRHCTFLLVVLFSVTLGLGISSPLFLSEGNCITDILVP